ncbi:unnamed protein product [Effrenium voratum]|nr:unnamed protein product [Effrenium voratum]
MLPALPSVSWKILGLILVGAVLSAVLRVVLARPRRGSILWVGAVFSVCATCPAFVGSPQSLSLQAAEARASQQRWADFSDQFKTASVAGAATFLMHCGMQGVSADPATVENAQPELQMEAAGLRSESSENMFKDLLMVGFGTALGAVGHALMKFKDELPKPTLATSGAIGLAFTASVYSTAPALGTAQIHHGAKTALPLMTLRHSRSLSTISSDSEDMRSDEESFASRWGGQIQSS